jgi:hypothetical protein
MKISDIFDIRYGNHCYQNKSNLTIGTIPLVSSKGSNNGIYGFFNIEPKLKRCITVPRTGSICDASYHNYDMDADDNTLVLTPKNLKMSDNIMLFYCSVIRTLKPRYFYGRQVTPSRLGNTVVPDKIPDWVYKIDISKYNIKPLSLKDKPKSLLPAKSKLFKLTDLFTISKGKGPSVREAEEKPGSIPLITATTQNNGVSCYTSIKAKHEGNCITITGDGECGICFYQSKPFNGQSISVLTPKFELTKNRAMYIIPIIEANKFKYNYGYKLSSERLQKMAISLPEKSGDVDWCYIDKKVEELIKSS